MKWKWKISFYYCKDKVSSGRRFAGKYALQCHNKAHGLACRGVAWHGALHCKCHILHTRWAAQMSAFEFKFEFEFWISLFGASCCFCLHYFEGKMMMVDLACLHAFHLRACKQFHWARRMLSFVFIFREWNTTSSCSCTTTTTTTTTIIIILPSPEAFEAQLWKTRNDYWIFK